MHLNLSPQSSVLGPRRRGGAYTGIVIYLGGFVVLLFFLLHYYVEPAVEAARSGSPLRRHWLGAVSWLMLAVLLAYLLVGLILTLRIGGLFFPRPGSAQKRVSTKHVDIWAEAGKRINVDEPEEPGDQ